MNVKNHFNSMVFLTIATLVSVLSGCGTTNSRSATEQLLMSDSVDRVISQISFEPLAGQTVFLDVSLLLRLKPQALSIHST